MVVWGWPLEPWEPRLWLEFKLSFPLVYVAMGQEGSLYLCCGTGCSASEVPAGLCWAEQDLASLMALEAWPEGLPHCPCRVTAHQSPVPPCPHVPLLPVPCSPVGGAAALICLQLEAAAVGGCWDCH